MELKRMPIKDIKPYENNPRINKDAVDAVAESIKQCTYVAPIIVDENMVILAGHTRHKALKKLGIKDVDVLIARDLTEEQKKKYRLLDNKTNEFAEWDMDKLAEELDGLDFDGFDFGFDNALDDPLPDSLDAEETEKQLVVRLKFGTYENYRRVEHDVKEFAEKVGVEMVVSME